MLLYSYVELLFMKLDRKNIKFIEIVPENILDFSEVYESMFTNRHNFKNQSSIDLGITYGEIISYTYAMFNIIDI